VKLKFLNEISGLGGISVALEGAYGRARLGRGIENRAKSATWTGFWNFSIKFPGYNLDANWLWGVLAWNFRFGLGFGRFGGGPNRAKLAIFGRSGGRPGPLRSGVWRRLIPYRPAARVRARADEVIDRVPAWRGAEVCSSPACPPAASRAWRWMRATGLLRRSPPGDGLRDPHVGGHGAARRKGGPMDEFVVSPDGPIIQSAREPPPDDLTPKQQAIWVEITKSLDRDWFGDSRPLLTELVAHIDFAAMLREGIEQVRAQLSGLVPGSREERAATKQLTALLRAHGKQSAAVAHLSTKLRLTPQARQSARRSDQVRRRTATRPWEWERAE